MKLYDSYGKLKEINKSELVYITRSDAERLGSVKDDIIKCIKETEGGNISKWHFRLRNNCLCLYANAIYENDVNETNFMRNNNSMDKTGGIELYFNPADGEVCRMTHFIADKGEWENGRFGITTGASGDIIFLRQSLLDDKYFPELQEIMERLPSKYLLVQKDPFAYDKNMYLMTAEASCKIPAGFIWNICADMKKIVKDISSDGGRITWTSSEGEPHFAVVNENRLICCKGNIYPSINQFVDAVKNDRCRYNERIYGGDKSFMELVGMPILEKINMGEYENNTDFMKNQIENDERLF